MRFPLAVLVLALAGMVEAAPITYMTQLTGSGNLGATSFTNQLVTLTLIGDTDNVINPATGIFRNPVASAIVTIGGINQTASFTNSIAAVVNQGIGQGGFSDLTQNRLILFLSNSAFSTYNLGSSIGPLAGSNPALNPPQVLFPTDLGGFNLTSVSGNPTYSAELSDVPEPSTAALAGLGLALAAWYRHRVSRKG